MTGLESVVLHVAIVHAPIDVAALLSLAQAPGVGAVSLFLGTVRDLNDGRPVSGMEYEAYAPMAESELRAIAEERTPGEVKKVPEAFDPFRAKAEGFVRPGPRAGAVG